MKYNVYSIDTKGSEIWETKVFETDSFEAARKTALSWVFRSITDSYKHDVEIRTDIDENGNYNTVDFA